MKTKITFKEAFEIAETLFGVLRKTKPDDMKLHEVKALFMIRDFDTNNLSEIKKRILKEFYHVPKKILDVKMAKTIKSLINKDLIKKEKCENDKRQVLLTITPRGQKLLKEINKKAEDKWKEVTND